MANDSGWGKRNSEGPPDLDEAFKALAQKIKSLFGGKSSPTEQPENQVPVMPVIGLILFVWAATGFYIVDQGSRGWYCALVNMWKRLCPDHVGTCLIR